MEDAPLAYDLRAPAAARGESITSQLQREILGDVAVAVADPEPTDTLRNTRQRDHPQSNQPENEELNGPNTPQPSGRRAMAADEDDDGDLIAISTPESLSQKVAGSPQSQQLQPQQQQQPQHDLSRPAAKERMEGDRRRTLSPSKALAFFNQEGITDSLLATTTTASSRRDTVSPESIRTLLQGLDESGDAGSKRASSKATPPGVGSPADESVDENVLSEYLDDVARTKQYLESSKLTLLQTPKGNKRRRSTRGQSLDKEQAMEQQQQSQPAANKHKTAVVADQDSFTDAFFSSTLMSRDDRGDQSGHEEDDEQKRQQQQQRRTTLEPMDAQSILSELRSEMMVVDDETEEPVTTNSTATTNTRPPTSMASTTTTSQRRESPSPNTRSRKRRATLDPNDLMAMSDGGDLTLATTVAAATQVNRRETIGDGDLLELRREFGMDPPAPAAPSPVSTRKKKTPSPSPGKRTKSKRTRFDELIDDNDDVDDAELKATPMKPKATSADLLDANDTLFSPPPTNRTNKTPLKSCLSARKASRRDQPTPSKSVNFGPPQGAEFNLGSPSTSMTPLPSRDARAMFPLHEKDPQQEPSEDDDDETSLNTSILDEADAQSSSDEERNAAVLLDAVNQQQQRKLSVDPLQQRTSRRRYSLRGVSPLDNQANARRQRRLSTTAVSSQPQSPLVSARNRRAFEAAAAAATAAAQAKSAASVPQKSSFLSASDVQPQSRLAYADSSASSDEGEDMEITGDYSNQATTAQTLQTGVRQSRLSESPRRSARLHSARSDSLFVDSPLSDTTIELGTLRDLVAETYEADEQEETKREEPDSSDVEMSEEDQEEGHEEEEEDAELAMGSLSDLAKEAEGDEYKPDHVSQRRVPSTQFAASQDKTLDPIVEGDDEDRRSSSAHSRMSIESDDDDESDDEYNAKRKSLVVNLASKFERFGSGTPKNRKQKANATSPDATTTTTSLLNKLRSPQRPVASSPSRSPRVLTQPPPSPSPVKLPDPLKTEEVLARVQLEEISREAVEAIDMSILQSDVQRSCVAHAAAGDLRFSNNEIASWCAGLADSLPALAHERVARVFSTDDQGTLTRLNEAIQALHILQSIHVRSGYCQWRTKLEKRVCEGLVQCENNLRSDAKTLRSQLDNDRSHRDSELRAIKELMERERQMEQLLDGIEEQQAVQREYQSSVHALEAQCSSLSLEASVLDQQMEALQVSSPHTDRTETTAIQLRRDVLELEELLALRESIGLWRVVSATGSKLVIVSGYDDVLFSVEVRVEINAAAATTTTDAEPHQSKMRVVSVFTNKTRQQSQQKESTQSDDAVASIAAWLLSQQRLEETVDASSLEMSQLPKQVATLSTTLLRAYQYLTHLRAISTVCGLRLETTNATTGSEANDEDGKDDKDNKDDENKTQRVLWVDFVRFPRALADETVRDGLKFSVGLRLQVAWPFIQHGSDDEDSSMRVAIIYGMVTEAKIRQQLDQIATQNGLEYLPRVCRRLHDVFLQNDHDGV